ncbi:hypothetical protein TNCV_2869741 [Trichonephila clavipes]|nr:hypothetical protein TNCV_2869741 [Trichonephila clavipes]
MLSSTSELNQGNTYNFNTFYWWEVIKSILDNLENQQNVTISILTALIMIDEAWRAVTPLTIQNCFKKLALPTLNIIDVYKRLMECNADPFLRKALPVQDLKLDDYV